MPRSAVKCTVVGPGTAEVTENEREKKEASAEVTSSRSDAWVGWEGDADAIAYICFIIVKNNREYAINTMRSLSTTHTGGLHGLPYPAGGSAG